MEEDHEPKRDCRVIQCGTIIDVIPNQTQFFKFVEEYNNFLERDFINKGCKYLLLNDNTVEFCSGLSTFEQLIIPSEVSNDIGFKYQVSCTRHYSDFYCFGNDYISFEKNSKIDVINLGITKICFKKFFLPDQIKRIIIANPFSSNIIIISDKENKFITIEKNNDIIHLHPYEISTCKYKRIHLIIRETTRRVGDMCFIAKENIKCVEFPASLEIIGRKAFMDCYNLISLVFNENSKLKIIYQCAFSNCTSIKTIDFPSSVVHICGGTFSRCRKLEQIMFKKDSKLKGIYNSVFESTNITQVVFPSSLLVIDEYAFRYCKRLESVTFDQNIIPKYLKPTAFENTKIRIECYKNTQYKDDKINFIDDFDFDEFGSFLKYYKCKLSDLNYIPKIE